MTAHSCVMCGSERFREFISVWWNFKTTHGNLKHDEKPQLVFWKTKSLETSGFIFSNMFHFSRKISILNYSCQIKCNFSVMCVFVLWLSLPQHKGHTAQTYRLYTMSSYIIHTVQLVNKYDIVCSEIKPPRHMTQSPASSAAPCYSLTSV